MSLIFELNTIFFFFLPLLETFHSGEINIAKAVHFLPVLRNNVAILELNARVDVSLRQSK